MNDTNAKSNGAPRQEGEAGPRPGEEQAIADALEAAEGASAPDPAAVIAELQADNARLRDQMLRAMAETENVRRRAEREREDTAKYAVTSFARDLAGVADNLARALEAAPGGQAPPDAVARLVEGVAATERELQAVFGRHGLACIDALDQRFDPNLHQAVFEVEGSGKPPGTVVQVMAPGYTLHGRLLRPAMVGVAKGQAPAERLDTTA